ncbi:MAG: YfhO family protein [Coriobacteriia bacterium]|nr:YfhO family protein [Coriobacteriia bacterium]
MAVPDNDDMPGGRRPASRRWRPLADLGVFSAIFAVALVSAACYLVIYHKSAIWSVDGVSAHYPMLYYLNLWLRRIVYDPGAGVPLWSWNIGLGSDVVGSLSWPVLGDPFAIISLLMPMAKMELAYTLAWVARLFVAGLVAFGYIRAMGARALAATAGALVHVFAVFALYAAMRHPFMANALVFLPLVLWGIERALDRRRMWLLPLAVMAAAVSNYYFFYMITIVAVIYAVARYVELTPKGERLRGFLPVAARVGGLYVLGVLMAAASLFPSAAAVLASGRSGAGGLPDLLFEMSGYVRMLHRLTAGIAPSAMPYLGFSAVGMALLPILFMRRGNLATKVMLVLFPVFVALPIVGSVFNGLSAPTGRFTFAWGLFIGLGAAQVLSSEQRISWREIRASLVFLAVYLVALYASGAEIKSASLLPLVLAAFALLVMAFEHAPAVELEPGSSGIGSRLGEAWTAPATRWVFVALIVAGIAGNAAHLYDFRYQNMLSSWSEHDTVLDRYLANSGMAAQKLPKDGFYRVEKQEYVMGPYATSPFSNDQLVQKYFGTSGYSSVMDSDLVDFMDEMNNRSRHLPFTFHGFDDRVGLLTLLGVEYYIGIPRYEHYVPYGFEPAEEYSTDEYTVYRNEHALPIGFVYDHAIERSVYEGMSVLEKQQVMLDAAVIDDGTLPELPRAEQGAPVIEVPYEVIATEGVDIDTDARSLTTTEDDARLTLDTTPVEDAELYVELVRLDFTVQSPLERPEEELGKNPSRLKVLTAEHRYRDFAQPGFSEIVYGAGGPRKVVRRYRDGHIYAWGDHSHVVNLGYKESGADEVTIDLDGIGSGTYESLHVWAIPMAAYEASVSRLAGRAMTDVEIGTNRVTGRVSSDVDGLLYLSIPFSEGWTAEVDGATVPTVRTNTAFTGVPIAAGEHDVTLRYFTPWLAEGLVTTAVAFAVFGAVIVVPVARRRARRSRAA